MPETSEKVISTNRKATFNYQVLETMEAGLVLEGTEIKSLRAQGCNMQESFVRMEGLLATLCQLEIPPYKFGNIQNHDPFRKRKLLLHKGQLKHLREETERNNLTCIPLRMVLRKGIAKLVIGLCKGKKLGDKRESVKKKEADREIKRAVKYRSRAG